MDYIYLYRYGNYSQRWYKTKDEAFQACVRNNRDVMYFGTPEYVGTGVSTLIKHIKNQKEKANLADKKDEYKQTGYDKNAIELIKQLKELLNVN